MLTHACSKFYNHCMKIAWMRSCIFPYTVFVCLYMEVITDEQRLLFLYYITLNSQSLLISITYTFQIIPYRGLWCDIPVKCVSLNKVRLKWPMHTMVIFRFSYCFCPYFLSVKPSIATSSLFAPNHKEEKRVGFKNVQYPCEADVGTPIPKVTWQKIRWNDSMVLANLSTGAGQANLEFVEISKDDDGGYRCIAENEGGVSYKDFYLYPTCKSKFSHYKTHKHLNTYFIVLGHTLLPYIGIWRPYMGFCHPVIICRVICN